MKAIKWLVNKTILNWEHPIYSQTIYKFCTKYLDLWYGDNNFNRYTNGEYRLLRLIIPKVSVVFDVGANIGEYSSEILKINSSVTIHAFEPGSEAFEKLKHLKLTANNFALGDKKERKMLYREIGVTTHSSFYNFHNNNLKPSEVEVQTIDEYCLKNDINHIDFLKVDVEGFEYFVLKGAQKMIGRGAIDYVQFEFSGATIEARVYLKDFILFFNKFGYILHRIKATSVEVVNYFPDRERFTLTNYLAVKNGLPVG